MPLITQPIERFGDYLTLKEASRLKKVHPNTLYQWLEYQKVPVVRAGRTILVSLSNIADYQPRSKGRTH